jgi:hypothetical protein
MLVLFSKECEGIVPVKKFKVVFCVEHVHTWTNGEEASMMLHGLIPTQKEIWQILMHSFSIAHAKQPRMHVHFNLFIPKHVRTYIECMHANKHAWRA